MDNLRISREQAHAMVAAGAKVIDVRSPEEFAAGAAPGAINVPVQVVAAEIARYAQPSDTLVVYCKAGGRADVAVRTLRAMGYAAAYNLGGLSDW
jgi:phage shock protein E